MMDDFDKVLHEFEGAAANYPITLTLELTKWENLNGLLDFLRHIRSAANGGHGFAIEADREDLGKSCPKVYVDGDGNDKIGRIFINGKDVTRRGTKPSLEKAVTIHNLPKNIKINDYDVTNMLQRGIFRPVAAPTKNYQYEYGPAYEVTFHPAAVPKGIKTYNSGYADRPRTSYYNPALADLETMNPEEPIIARQYAKAKSNVKTTIDPLPGYDIIYRGMSGEEYNNFLKTGKIQSKGDYNLGDEQKGLTYWSTDPEQATYYSHGFAPRHMKATFSHPAYVVAARMPKEVKPVAGTDSREIGVARSITKNEIIGVWRGTPYNYQPAQFRIRQQNTSYDPNLYESDGGVSADAQLAWEKIK